MDSSAFYAPRWLSNWYIATVIICPPLAAWKLVEIGIWVISQVFMFAFELYLFQTAEYLKRRDEA